MQPLTLAKRVWPLLLLVVIAFYFYGLGHFPFVGPDEPRYAQVAREMFLRGDLITPTLGGDTWFEKPPLLYWIMIASFRLFGISEWAARLGPALSGILTIGAVFWVGRRVCRSSADTELRGLGPWSAVIAASFLGVIVFSRGLGFDIVVTMTITWALSFFLVSELTEPKRNLRLLAGFYCFVGLALLAKGLVGVVVPMGVVGAYHLLRRQLPTKRFVVSLAWGLPLVLAVAAIWYVPVIKRHGWLFVDEFFVQHHFARYLSNKYHHPQPFFFYLLIIFPLSLPWTAYLIEGLMKVRTWSFSGGDALEKLRIFALAWCALPFVFFSFSSSKLPGYILPVLPALALIAGERVARFASRSGSGLATTRITGAIFALFAAAGLCYAIGTGSLDFWCAAAIAAPLAVTAAICFFWTRQTTISALSIVGATFAAVVIALNCGLPRFADRESVRELIRMADARGYSAAPVYGLHEINRSIEFYAAGRVVYASDGNPMKLEGAYQALDAARQTKGPVLVVVPIQYLPQLTELSEAKLDVIGDNGREALVAVSSL